MTASGEENAALGGLIPSALGYNGSVGAASSSLRTASGSVAWVPVYYYASAPPRERVREESATTGYLEESLLLLRASLRA